MCLSWGGGREDRRSSKPWGAGGAKPFLSKGLYKADAPYTIIMHPYGYQKLMTLCTLHNYYAPVWLPETDGIMRPAQLLCTRMATGN